MIIKSLSRKSNSGQLVKYVCRYVLKEKSGPESKGQDFATPENATVILRYNLRSRSPNGYIKEFQENESYRIYRRKDSVTLFHTIHSFSPLDKEQITDKILKDIAKKYVHLRGENNLYLGVAHKDKEHTHLHIIVSGTQLNGYSSRVSKQQFQHIKLELEKYQKEKYPQLTHSFTDHAKSKRKTREEVIEQIKTTRQTDKRTIATALDKTFKNAKSKDDFFKQLTDEGYEPYYRNDKFQGVLVEGRKFRLNRLGYDDQKLDELNQIIPKEEKALSELQSLRTGQTKTIQRDMLIESKNIVTANELSEQNALEEMRNIRQRNEARVIEEQIHHSNLETERGHEDLSLYDEDTQTSKATPVVNNQFNNLRQKDLEHEMER